MRACCIPLSRRMHNIDGQSYNVLQYSVSMGMLRISDRTHLSCCFRTPAISASSFYLRETFQQGFMYEQVHKMTTRRGEEAKRETS